MRLFKINSIQFKLFIFISFLVVPAILIITWISSSFLTEQIRQERIHTVGRVAKNRHRQLVLQLSTYKQNAQNLIDRVLVLCSSNDLKIDIASEFRTGMEKEWKKDLKNHLKDGWQEHFDKNCILERLQMQLNLENMNGIIFRQAKNDIALVVGKVANSNIKETDFSKDQLGVFTKRESENLAQPFYIMASDKEFGVEILIEHPLEAIQKIFRPLDDLGNSGETFLVDKEGFFVTETRYHSRQGISEIISANPMRICLQKNNQEVLDLDYRNEPIIHGFRYVPEIGGGCIMAHIEQKEAFAPLLIMTRKIIIIALALLIISLLLTFIFSRKITRPLIYLTKLSREIGEGNYHLKSEIQREDEIGLLSNSFNQMTDKLIIGVKNQQEKLQAEIANEQKSVFLANMSHEMRTPLHSIIGITEILTNSSLEKEQSDLIRIAHNAGENLLCIINDTLDLSRIESGVLNIENIPFLLSEEIQSCIAIVGIRAQRKKINLSWQIEESLNNNRKGDPTRLRQIILNLLNNAVKFSDKGAVSLHVKKMTDEQGQDKLLFSVIDQGIGIPADKQNVIFESFKQADESVTRKFGGTGLGLAISKKLVELMNGKIWVESEIGKGSTFYFSIDLPETGITIRDSLKKVDMEKGRSLKILIADDNEVNLLIFELFLRKKHHVFTSRNGQEAFEMCKKDKFDLVFLDVGMPIMDGYTATNQIRLWEKEHNKERTTIIACTANAFETDTQKSLKAGCDGHLAKPFSKEKLLEIIAEYSR